MYKIINNEKLIVAIGVFVITFLLQFFFAYLLQLAWNLTLPSLFGVSQVTYSQSVIFIFVLYFISLKFKVVS